MKEIQYKPKVEGFSGSVTIQVPSHAERLVIMEKMGITVDEHGRAVQANKIAAARMMSEEVEKRVVAVNLKHESGEELSSFDDLTHSTEGGDVINELGGLVMQGVKLGNG